MKILVTLLWSKLNKKIEIVIKPTMGLSTTFLSHISKALKKNFDPILGNLKFENLNQLTPHSISS